MKKHLALLLGLSLFPFALVSQREAYSQGLRKVKAPYAQGQILVKVREDFEPVGGADSVAGEILPAMGKGAERIGLGDGVDLGGRGGLYVVELEGSVSVEEAVAAASADPRVEYAEPDYLLFTNDTMPNDPAFTQQWGLFNTGAGGTGKPGADIGAPSAWDGTVGSNDIVVAIIDTGVEVSHPDLRNNVWVNPGEVGGNGVDEDGNGFVDDVNGWNFFRGNNAVFESPTADRHGTHVAGIIGAEGNNGTGVAGVAWNVKLMSVKFIHGTEGESSDAIKSINYAIDQRKRFDRGQGGANVKVINASWGGPGEGSPLRNAIKDARDAGILFVCSAGNGEPDFIGDDIDADPADPNKRLNYPASWSPEVPSIIAVASLDRFDNLSTSSNFGRKSVSVAAPGVQVFSTWPTGLGSYSFSSGTSMAAPHVVGVAVLLWAQEPSLTLDQVKQRIISTGEPLGALVPKTLNPVRINASNALANRVPTPALAVTAVETNKKKLTIDGLGLEQGSVTVEVNGLAQSGSIKFDSAYRLANGTFTRLTSKLGKSRINSAFPRGVPVAVTLFNTRTGERSQAFSYTRPSN